MARWVIRQKPALNAFAVAYEGRIVPSTAEGPGEEYRAMFKALKNRIDRWSQVEGYKNDNDIRGALEWVLDRANYRALMKAFAEDALSPDSGVSEDERRILLACLERAERGEKVTADSLPRITNRAGRLMIGAWLTNATRQDLGGMPTMEVGVVPMSYYCDDDTGRVIDSTFRALGCSERAFRVAENAGVRTWAEVMPFVSCVCFAACGSSLSFADALLLLRAGNGFPIDLSLGALYLPRCSTMIVRTKLLGEMGGLLRLPIGAPLPVADVEHRLSQGGWTVRSIL